MMSVQTRGDQTDENQSQPGLIWEIGTAYDLFISLEVLHRPEEFGLRPSWAAGVRSRVPAEERRVLEDGVTLLDVLNLPWIHDLPQPKDSTTVLWALGRIPPEERLPTLFFDYEKEANLKALLMEVAYRKSWNDDDRDQLRDLIQSISKKTHTVKELSRILDWWARPAEFGELFLSALRSYYEVFFVEEERRILPALRSALENARGDSQQMSIQELIRHLSQGVWFESLVGIEQLVLTPSYWSTPFIFFSKYDEKKMVLAFGGRPAGTSLVPGEEVPDALLQALKALADPTRLRILRYLAAQPLTSADLSRRLRLRLPTVIHHLHALRIAGLLNLTLEAGGEKRYSARKEALDEIFTHVADFLREDNSTS